MSIVTECEHSVVAVCCLRCGPVMVDSVATDVDQFAAALATPRIAYHYASASCLFFLSPLPSDRAKEQTYKSMHILTMQPPHHLVVHLQPLGQLSGFMCFYRYVSTQLFSVSSRRK